MRFADQCVIVTGGGSGIGEVVSRRFAAEGAAVVVADRAGPSARNVAASIADRGGKAIATEVDVTSDGDVERMVTAAEAAFARVDILVNNAAAFKGDDLLGMVEADWDLDVDVSLKGAFLCCKRVLPGMIERQRGVVLNIASVNGLGGYGNHAYSAAKAGLINLTENLAVRYGRHGIRANAIAPATVRTPAWSERLRRDPDLFARLEPWYPLGRVGEADDIANAVLFLASREASWITGINLRVDGGLLAGSDGLARAVCVESPDQV